MAIDTRIMDLKERVKLFAKGENIDLIGFTTAEPFEELREILLERKRLKYLSGFEEKEIELRIDPKKTMKNAESIIVIGIPYYYELDEINEPKFYGELARTAWGKDYHRVLHNKLEAVAAFLASGLEGFEYKAFVDTGPLVDRQVAYRAGLGWYGHQTALINQHYGSWIYIGYLLTNIPFQPDEPLKERCLGCNLCIEHCPTGAIEKPYLINTKKCLSCILQKKEAIPLNFREKIGKRIYGCDVCQEVCPHNKVIQHTKSKEFIEKGPAGKIDLIELLNISNKNFKEIFGENASGWRGKKILQRNAIIALKNHQIKEAVIHLIPLLQDQREEIRQYALWAIIELDPQGALSLAIEMKK